MISTGIIGSGNMAKDIAQALNSHGQFFLKTICDIDLEKAKNLASLSACGYETDYQRVLEDPDIELIYIATPPKTHAEIFIASLLAKKHTVCEKPLCLRDDEAKSMLAAALKAENEKIISAINYPMAFIPAMEVMKKIIVKGELGDIRHIEIGLHFPIWPRPQLRFSKTDWINSKDNGGILREIGSHYLFALLELFPTDPVARVCAKVGYVEQGAESQVSAILTKLSGLSINLSLAANYSQAKEDIYLRIYGLKKSLSLENFQILKIACGHEDLVLHPCSMGIDEKAFMSSMPMISALATSIKQLKNYSLVPIAKGVEVQRILDAILSSHGRPIELL